MIEHILLFVFFSLMAFLFLMLIRNEWVYSVRSKILNEDFDRYGELPTYDEMMKRFWVWDVSKFFSRPVNKGK